jgi:maltose O-acetyltransferase
MFNIIHFIKNSKLLAPLIKIGSYIFTLKYRIFYRDRVTFGKNFIANWNFRISGPGKVIFGDNIIAGSYAEPNEFITHNPNSVIIVGDNCRLNGAHLEAEQQIRMGINCILGSTIIVDSDMHSIYPDRLTNPNALVASAPIEIEDNVWIAGRSGILKGVTIGENSVIGFGAVVSKDIPPNVIAAGNPATIVKDIPVEQTEE